MAAEAITVARRDSGEKQQIRVDRVPVAIDETLRDVQTSLFRRAQDEQERRTLRNPAGYEEMIDYLRDAAGFVVAPWCGRRECEERVKDDSSATIRCLPLDMPPAGSGRCTSCGRTAAAEAIWAQGY